MMTFLALAIALGASTAVEAEQSTILASFVPASKTTVVEPPIIWQHTYGDDDLFAYDVIQTSDGKFAVTGERIFYDASAHEGGEIYLLKTEANGLKFSQTFDGYGIGRFYTGVFIQQTGDTGFVIAGSGTEFPHGFCYLVQYDPSGNIVWSKTYRPDVGNSTCNGATATQDGGYLLVGSVKELSGAEKVYIVKTDALGNMEWDSTISNPSGLGDTGGIARSVTNAPGGYAITGVVYDKNATTDSAFLLRLNKFGKVIAKNHYNFSLPDTTKTDIDSKSIQYTKDGFIMAGSAIGYQGSTHPRAAFLLKVSTSGQVRWLNTYGLNTFSSATSVSRTRDGGYILAGVTDNYDISSSVHAYIARTDSSGKELWSKTITDYAVSGGAKITGIADGGYIMAGMAVPGGASDTLLVRIAPDIKMSK